MFIGIIFFTWGVGGSWCPCLPDSEPELPDDTPAGCGPIPGPPPIEDLLVAGECPEDVDDAAGDGAEGRWGICCCCGCCCWGEGMGPDVGGLLYCWAWTGGCCLGMAPTSLWMCLIKFENKIINIIGTKSEKPKIISPATWLAVTF